MTLKLQRILVPVDFSPSSRDAVIAAAALAERFDASLNLLHVWQVPPLRPDLMVWAEADGFSLREYARKTAEEELGAFIERLKLDPTTTVSHELAPGDPATVIVERAALEAYDLIVMGTRGRSGLAHLLLGSVAEKVVRHAPCPVLTVGSKSLEHVISSTHPPGTRELRT